VDPLILLGNQKLITQPDKFGSCPEILFLLRSILIYPKNPSRSEALCDISKEAYFLRRGVVSPTPNLQSHRGDE
jgi:hypothetical protein